MRVIGTAGHVDHGKSSLVLALTGMDPDRLREEKEREMTIDLGFAWMTLPGGVPIGIVDVPGHRDFIENMLAGVGGIDAALLVIAADEGVMPQTLEHLAILDLLEIENAVAAITKIDLSTDPEWLGLVEEEIKELLASTVLNGAQLVRVSAKTGEGLNELQQGLLALVKESVPRRDLGRPRLPIDRAFSMPGFGTIVTGTLIDGVLEVGQEVVLLPKRIKGRVRGIQTHKEALEQASPGSRVAINLSGTEVKRIGRGDVVCLPGSYDPTRLIDVHFRLLKDAAAPLKHDQRAKLYIGASQATARVRLLGRDTLGPGESGWLQLELGRPIVAARGDLFILRRPSPGATLGGGHILDVNPKGFYRRRDMTQLKRLAALWSGDPVQVVEHLLDDLGLVKVKEAEQHSKLSTGEFAKALNSLETAGKVLFVERLDRLPESTVMTASTRDRLVEKSIGVLKKYHEQYPLRLGMPKEELRSRLKVEAREYPALLSHFYGIQFPGEGKFAALDQHSAQLSVTQQKVVEALLREFDDNPYSPPDTKQILESGGEEILTYLLQQGVLRAVSDTIVFKRETYEAIVERIRSEIKSKQEISVADVRDILQTSRKYALAFMEHLDQIGMTERVGDVRIFKEESPG